MKKILEFHGNGSIVDTGGSKHQAEEAPSFKRQASSAKPVRQIVARQYVLLTEATSTKHQATSAKRTRSVRQFVALTQDLVVRHYATLTQEPRTTVHFSSLKIFLISSHESASGQP